MARRTEIDMKRLQELVDMGKSEDEMMAALDIRERATLQEALQGVMREKASGGKSRGVKSTKAYTESGERIHPAMAEDTRVREGEAFDHQVTDEGVSVKKKADESIEEEAGAGRPPGKKKEE